MHKLLAHAPEDKNKCEMQNCKLDNV